LSEKLESILDLLSLVTYHLKTNIKEIYSPDSRFIWRFVFDI